MHQLYSIRAAASEAEDYAVCFAHMEQILSAKIRHRRRKRWLLLLLLPYVALCFPQLYARATPSLWGFPFFYWYQFAWVIVTSALMGIVYWKFNDEDAK